MAGVLADTSRSGSPWAPRRSRHPRGLGRGRISTVADTGYLCTGPTVAVPQRRRRGDADTGRYRPLSRNQKDVNTAHFRQHGPGERAKPSSRAGSSSARSAAAAAVGEGAPDNVDQVQGAGKSGPAVAGTGPSPGARVRKRRRLACSVLLRPFPVPTRRPRPVTSGRSRGGRRPRRPGGPVELVSDRGPRSGSDERGRRDRGSNAASPSVR
jgi:hypothetical protein